MPLSVYEITSQAIANPTILGENSEFYISVDTVQVLQNYVYVNICNANTTFSYAVSEFPMGDTCNSEDLRSVVNLSVITPNIVTIFARAIDIIDYYSPLGFDNDYFPFPYFQYTIYGWGSSQKSRIGLLNL